VGFQYREDAERFQEELQTRLAKFGLELNTDKTRLIEFGRRAERDRKRRGEGKPETFNTLGFTHSCGRHRKGYFTLWRKTTRKRMVAKLRQIKQQLQQRRHEPIPIVGEWLKQVVTGYYNYHAVPGNRWATRESRPYRDQPIRFVIPNFLATGTMCRRMICCAKYGRRPRVCGLAKTQLSGDRYRDSSYH
jgi:hypothetical protein